MAASIIVFVVMAAEGSIAVETHGFELVTEVVLGLETTDMIKKNVSDQRLYTFLLTGDCVAGCYCCCCCC